MHDHGYSEHNGFGWGRPVFGWLPIINCPWNPEQAFHFSETQSPVCKWGCCEEWMRASNTQVLGQRPYFFRSAPEASRNAVWFSCHLLVIVSTVYPVLAGSLHILMRQCCYSLYREPGQAQRGCVGSPRPHSCWLVELGFWVLCSLPLFVIVIFAAAFSHSVAYFLIKDNTLFPMKVCSCQSWFRKFLVGLLEQVDDSVSCAGQPRLARLTESVLRRIWGTKKYHDGWDWRVAGFRQPCSRTHVEWPGNIPAATWPPASRCAW